MLSNDPLMTRRRLLQLGAATLAAGPALPALAAQDRPDFSRLMEKIDPYFTPQEKFRDVSRGKPLPHKLPPEKKAKVGLTRESWKMTILSDPDHPAEIGNPVTLDWNGLMDLAKKRTVSFPKLMTCNNIGQPLGMGLWEGVPLRDAIWLTKPEADLRRVFYYGYHNDDPKQMFRSSLPIGRILEDPPGHPPVILCFKLNGEVLNSERGGPVRILVPETYGFKSVKWLTHVVLSNLSHANDTYAGGNNDVDSHLKTFARTLSFPRGAKPNRPVPILGYAQVGLSGLARVQVWVSKLSEKWPKNDPYFTKAPWEDAEILPPPRTWAALPGGKLPGAPMGFDPETGTPKQWPLPLTKAHWGFLLPGLPEGKHVLRFRTIDGNGYAQPMPRPFRKSGRTAIERRLLIVKA